MIKRAKAEVVPAGSLHCASPLERFCRRRCHGGSQSQRRQHSLSDLERGMSGSDCDGTFFESSPDRLIEQQVLIPVISALASAMAAMGD
jgi:hypothetical protein